MMNRMRNQYKHGCAHGRDLILCVIGGMMNDVKCMPNSEKEKAYMDVYKEIVDRYGDLFEDWKA